jgi:FAD/FMN-containing dehydrogenase
MDRRQFLRTSAAAVPAVSAACTSELIGAADDPIRSATRVRPGDPAWPSAERWEELKTAVHGRLVALKSPLDECRDAPDGAACAELFKELKNPYYIGDHPELTQTSGWVDAWTSRPSVYAVTAAETTDVVAAVNFAREHNLRLVVKGGGHSYLGTSNSADSLLVWTRAMKQIEVHDAFVPNGCAGKVASQPAVSVGAGTLWMQVYDAVTTYAGRYVQGGGCGTVGVAGLIQGGGFGSFSKNYGLAAAGLLEAEIVTADGKVRIANAATHPDLFWALKGGGGGSFGVVTRLTLRTRELPEFFGVASGALRARSDAAFRDLATRVLGFYREHLFNPHWGEQIRFGPGNVVQFFMLWQGLTREQAQATWKPFAKALADAPDDFTVRDPMMFIAIPARRLWDAEFMRAHFPGVVARDDRPGSPAGNVFWASNRGEAGQFLHGYRSAWLPASLLEPAGRPALAEALVAASRRWLVALHFNKGLAGAPAEELAAARETAMNPAVADAFALAIIAGEGPPAFPGIRGHEPDLARARRDAGAINRSMDALLKVVPDPGSYVAETDYFERSWQRSFWGPNYPRLLEVKKKYDPAGLFFVRHGVGSEGWSEDGFTRVKGT